MNNKIIFAKYLGLAVAQMVIGLIALFLYVMTWYYHGKYIALIVAIFAGLLCVIFALYGVHNERYNKWNYGIGPNANIEFLEFAGRVFVDKTIYDSIVHGSNMVYIFLEENQPLDRERLFRYASLLDIPHKYEESIRLKRAVYIEIRMHGHDNAILRRRIEQAFITPISGIEREWMRNENVTPGFTGKMLVIRFGTTTLKVPSLNLC